MLNEVFFRFFNNLGWVLKTRIREVSNFFSASERALKLRVDVFPLDSLQHSRRGLHNFRFNKFTKKFIQAALLANYHTLLFVSAISITYTLEPSYF